MAFNNTSNASAILAPAEVETLLLQPVEAASVAAQVSTALRTSSHSLRIPSVSRDPQAAWTAEGSEIDPSSAQLEEVSVTPAKLAGLTVLSNELVNDSNPQAPELIGAGLTRDIARRLDEAFFSTVTGPGSDVAPGGLNAAGVTEIHSHGVDTWTDLDVPAEGVYRAQTEGASVSHWVVSPATFRALSTVKESQGSARGLLEPDATQPSARLMAGRPVLVSSHVSDDVLWAIDATQGFMVTREDVTLEADTSAFFSKDSTAVRAILRVGFAFTNPAGIVKIVADLDDPGAE